MCNQPVSNSGIDGRYETADIFDKEVNVTRFADPIDPLTPAAEVNVVHFAEPFPPVTETCCSAEAPHQFDDQVSGVETLVPAQALATTVRTMLPKATSGPHPLKSTQPAAPSAQTRASQRVDADPLLQYGFDGRVTEDSPCHPSQLQDKNWRRMKPGTASQVQARLHDARLALRHGIGADG